jgi:2-polyprenyl-3-methyl-5-hydroxy-6-metoxy-1,4-benzoquinol methylase
MKGSVKQKARDDRDFDTTSLSADNHGKNMHRDYTAHFFRWNFARRFIDKNKRVLEIGCGVERPLARILLTQQFNQADHYVGVDLNKLPSSSSGRSRETFIGEFNFVKRWKELSSLGPFDVILHYEVIEHMLPVHGMTMLRACRELLGPGGTMLMSTPCYDGTRHAANHIHEYTVAELTLAVKKAGFTVDRRWGTFMDLRHIPKAHDLPPGLADAVRNVYDELEGYYDRDALSCFFAPLFPDHSRNNLWVCRK